MWRWWRHLYQNKPAATAVCLPSGTTCFHFVRLASGRCPQKHPVSSIPSGLGLKNSTSPNKLEFWFDEKERDGPRETGEREREKLTTIGADRSVTPACGACDVSGKEWRKKREARIIYSPSRALEMEEESWLSWKTLSQLSPRRWWIQGPAGSTFNLPHLYIDRRFIYGWRNQRAIHGSLFSTFPQGWSSVTHRASFLQMFTQGGRGRLVSRLILTSSLSLLFFFPQYYSFPLSTFRKRRFFFSSIVQIFPFFLSFYSFFFVTHTHYLSGRGCWASHYSITYFFYDSKHRSK